MAYTTPQALRDLYGEDALSRIADRDGDYVADDDVIAAAISRADAEIDTHLGARYALPLDAVPEMLAQLSSDIAIYRLATDAGGLTEEHRTRYEDAVKLLTRIAEGKAALVFPPDPEAPESADEDAPAGPRPIVADGPPRLFTREMTREL